jgi:hypothetical protein
MKFLLFLAGVIAVALAGTSAYLMQQLGSERSRAQQAETKVAELESRLNTMERKRVAALQASAQPPSDAAPPDAATTTAKSDQRSEAGGEREVITKPWENKRQRMWSTPSSRSLMRAERIQRLKQQSPELARALGVSDAEAENLYGVLADQELRTELSLPEMRRAGLSWNEVQARQKRELTEKLGEERMRRYEAYQQGAPDRAQVRVFRSMLGEADTLTDAQAESLSKALQEERERYAQEIRDQIGPGATFTMGVASGRSMITNVPRTDEDGQERQILEQMETYARHANERAATLLSPRQLKVFEQMTAARLSEERLTLRSMRETDPRK